MDQSKPLLAAIVEDDAPSRTALGRHVRIDLHERLRVAGSAPPIIVTTSRHEKVIREPA